MCKYTCETDLEDLSPLFHGTARKHHPPDNTETEERSTKIQLGNNTEYSLSFLTFLFFI